MNQRSELLRFLQQLRKIGISEFRNFVQNFRLFIKNEQTKKMNKLELVNPHVMDVKEFVKRKSDQEHFVTRILYSKKVMILGDENDLTNF